MEKTLIVLEIIEQRRFKMVKADVVIYGTDGCPFCQKAREDYGNRATFINVKADQNMLKEMLEYSNGVDKVAVIVEGGKVSIGYGGS
jgi:glutaredoxin 3